MFKDDNNPCPTHSFYINAASIKITDMGVLMDIFHNGKGRVKPASFLHEFQHYYWDVLHEACPLKMKEQYSEI